MATSVAIGIAIASRIWVLSKALTNEAKAPKQIPKNVEFNEALLSPSVSNSNSAMEYIMILRWTYISVVGLELAFGTSLGEPALAVWVGNDSLGIISQIPRKNLAHYHYDKMKDNA